MPASKNFPSEWQQSAAEKQPGRTTGFYSSTQRRPPVKIEDILTIMQQNLQQAEQAVSNTALSPKDRTEAIGAKKAYAHCINLIHAVLEKKGWTSPG
jgi:hypothetical protein